MTITLTTDFGPAANYIAAMKRALGNSSTVHDITHTVPPPTPWMLKG